MRYWVRVLSSCIFLLVPVVARAAVPLDDKGFTLYLQQKLQLYSPVPVTVFGPLAIHVAVAADNTVAISLHDLHDACVRTPDKCDDIVGAYVQNAARTVLSSSPPAAATISNAGSALVPSDRAAFMDYVAGKAARLMPEAKVEADGLNLAITRPGGRRLLLSQQPLYGACQAAGFRCSATVDDYLGGMREWLALPAPEQMRVSLHIMASCNVVASVGNSMFCTVKPSPDPLAPFFRRAFSNLEELCFKAGVGGGVVPMTNADRHDLRLDMGEALDLCDKSTHAALGPLDARRQPVPADGIGAIVAPYAASYALYPGEWAGLAAGGHLIIAVPGRDMLLYSTADGPADIAALGARARAAFAGSGLAISTDVYRWTGDGWTLATAQSTMTGGPVISSDAMPHVH